MLSDIKTLMVQELLAAHPYLPERKVQQAIDKYCLLFREQLLANWDMKSDNNDPLKFFISTHKLTHDLGRFNIPKTTQQVYWLTAIQTLQSRMYTPVVVGDSIRNKITMVTLNYELEDILIAQGDGKELVDAAYAGLIDTPRDQHWVDIDLTSLEAFITGNLNYSARNNPDASPKLIQKLNSNLRDAMKLRLIATELGGKLCQLVNESEFGRRYYVGPNLQNCGKDVRHAALGDCYEYDIESSVFAWRLTEFRRITALEGCDEQMIARITSYTRELIDHKSAVRNNICQRVFGNTHQVNLIKSCLTAIGFGAKATATGYITDSGNYQQASLNTIITSKRLLKRFLEDEWVSAFMEEQLFITKILVEYYSTVVYPTECATLATLQTPTGRLQPSSLLAYAYQHNERAMLEGITEFCSASEVLLTVHDCIYTRRPVKLAELREYVASWGEFYRIDSAEHRAFSYNSELAAHHQHMVQEELAVAQALGTTARIPDMPEELKHQSQRKKIKKSRDQDKLPYDCGVDYGDSYYIEPEQLTSVPLAIQQLLERQ